MTADARARVAVVIRTKDRDLLLARALDDVLEQSFEDWTAVVVNDGGAPEPVDRLVAQRSARWQGRVQVIHNDVSRGMESASNQGIRATDSELVAIHDDDDTWHPDFLRRCVRHLDETACGGVIGRTEIVWEEITADGSVVENGREIFQPHMRSVTYFDLLRWNRAVPISCVYRRAAHDDVGYYDERLTAVGDWEFLLRLALDHDIDFLDGEPIAYWHQRRGSAGAFGNSVLTMQEDHQRFDLLVRDEAVRMYAREHGPGALLYLTRFLDNRNHELNLRLDILEGKLDELLRVARDTEPVVHRLADRTGHLADAVSDASLTSLIRRRYRRLRARRG